MGCLPPSSPSWGFTFFDHHAREGREGDAFLEVSADVSWCLLWALMELVLLGSPPNLGMVLVPSRQAQNRGDASRKHQGPVGGRG